jgi:hypothetical protein
MNHSFDRRIRSFAAQLPVGATVSNLLFHDVDRMATTDWLPSTAPGSLSWTAPAGAPTAPQDWGLLYTFSFSTAVAPSAAGASSIVLGIEEAPGGQIVVPILGPQVP